MRTAGHRTTTGLTACAVAVLFASGACVPQGLSFRVDERLTIESPTDRSTVGLPVAVEWRVDDFMVVEPGTRQPTDDEGYFGVFVDKAPVPPGKPLSWVARKDESCRPAEGCPDEEYLESRGIYATTDTRIVLDDIARIRVDEDETDWHTVTIVFLDTAGFRIGESAFQVDFHLKRQQL